MFWNIGSASRSKQALEATINSINFNEILVTKPIFLGFRVFDQETSGKIMAAEIKHCLMALGKSWKSNISKILKKFPPGERMTADQVDEILDVANADDDGMVKYEGEFFDQNVSDEKYLLRRQII